MSMQMRTTAVVRPATCILPAVKTAGRRRGRTNAIVVRCSYGDSPKKILMMGGTRFIGVYLARMLIEQGHEVTLFTRGKKPIATQIPDDTPESFSKFSSKIKHIAGDRMDFENLKKQLKGSGFQVVYDINGREAAEVMPVVEALPNLEQYIYCSSAGVYKKSPLMPHIETDEGDPKSRHKGKLDTEDYLSRSGVNYTSIRPVYIYGPLNYNPVEEWFFHRLAAGRPVPIPGSGLQTTQLGHVKDLARAFTKVLGNKKAARQIYNVSGKKYVTFDGLARACAKAMGAPEPELVHFNAKDFDFGKDKPFPLRDQHFFTSILKAQEDLEWEPEFDLIEGLRDSYVKDYSKGRFCKKPDFKTDDMILSKLGVKIGSKSTSAAPSKSNSSSSTGGVVPASLLEMLKVEDIMALARAKKITIGREPSRQQLVSSLASASVSLSDLSKGQLGDIAMKLGLPVSGEADVLRQRIAGTGKVGQSSSSSSSLSSSSAKSGSFAAPALLSGGTGLPQSLLEKLKADELLALARAKKITLPRTAGRGELVGALVKAGVSLSDLSKGQLGDLAVKLGLPATGSVDQLRSLIMGGSAAGSAASNGKSASSAAKPSAGYAAPAAAVRSGPGLPSSIIDMMKVEDLLSLARSKGLTLPGRSPSRSDVVTALSGASVSLSDLSKGQLGDIAMKLGLPVAGDVAKLRSDVSAKIGGGNGASAPAPAKAAQPTYSAPRAAPAAPTPSRVSSAGGSYLLSESTLGLLKIDDLMALCRTKEVSVPRNTTRGDLTKELVKARVSVQDLSKGQLMDVCVKLGQPTSGDLAALQSRVKSAGLVAV